MGSSVGVFCLISDAGDVTLWNPATREVRTVFHFNVDESLEEFHRFGKEGYGFLCVCDDEAAADFRFIGFYSPPDTTEHLSLTYYLSTNVWTSRIISNFFFDYIDLSPVELNGTLHWYAVGDNDINEDVEEWGSFPIILTYDSSSPLPTVKTIEMLPELHMLPCADNFVLTKYDNKYLSFIVRPGFSEYTEVWVMFKYGVTESWVMKVRVRPVSSVMQVVLSGHWSNLGTFFVFVDDEENVKWVI